YGTNRLRPSAEWLLSCSRPYDLLLESKKREGRKWLPKKRTTSSPSQTGSSGSKREESQCSPSRALLLAQRISAADQTATNLAIRGAGARRKSPANAKSRTPTVVTRK